MKRKDFWKGFGVALALIVVLNLAWKPICRAIPWHVLPFEISMSKNAKVDMIQSYLDKYYVEDIDQGKLEDTLFAGMLAGVGDKYTYYMPKENLRQYLTNTNGNFDGVGIEIYTTQDGEVVISSVMPGQPAETAGLQAGDVPCLDGTHQLVHDGLQRFDLACQMQVILAEGVGGAVQHVLHGVLKHLQLFAGVGGEVDLLGVHLLCGFQKVHGMVADALEIADGVEQSIHALAVRMVQLTAGQLDEVSTKAHCFGRRKLI